MNEQWESKVLRIKELIEERTKREKEDVKKKLSEFKKEMTNGREKLYQKL